MYTDTNSSDSEESAPNTPENSDSIIVSRSKHNICGSVDTCYFMRNTLRIGIYRVYELINVQSRRGNRFCTICLGGNESVNEVISHIVKKNSQLFKRAFDLGWVPCGLSFPLSPNSRGLSRSDKIHHALCLNRNHTSCYRTVYLIIVNIHKIHMFLLGLHGRCGENSPIRALQYDVVQLILSCYFYSHFEFKSEVNHVFPLLLG